VLAEWGGAWQGDSTVDLVAQHERQLPPGSFAELVLNTSSQNWFNSRQKLANEIEEKMKNAHYRPWTGKSQMVYCSLINPTITVRWIVPEYRIDHSIDNELKTGVVAASVPVLFVIKIVIGALIALLAYWAVKTWLIKAHDNPMAGSPVAPAISVLGIAAITGYFAYLFWLQKMRQRK